MEDANARAIKVALIITELSAGGAEKALFSLATRLDRTRFAPTVVSLSGRARDRRNSLAPALRERGIETLELDLRSLVGVPRALARLTRVLKSGRFEVAQCFLEHANLLGRVAARLAGVPVVCSGIRVAQRDAPFRAAVDRLTGGLVDAWVCVGESVARYAREERRLPSDRVFSIPNGVSAPSGALLNDFVAPPPPPSPFGRGRKRMIAVGRLTRQKGFDELLGDVKSWLTPALAREWELWIVGDGEERERLEAEIAALGLGEVAYLPGWRADVGALVADSELFLLPSRWEGMPNALLEAASLGKACLCRDVEGAREILGDASDAQICDAVACEQWRVKARALLEDEELRRRLGDANRARARKEFSEERAAERYAALWRRLLEAKARR